ncbi:MAG: hypothetical protein Kow0029_10790 [Candidatus Rifleibacteriota bacterium]
MFAVITVCFFFGIADRWFLTGGRSGPVAFNFSQLEAKDGSRAKLGNINILVMGVDSVEGTHRADTIFVLGVNPSKSRISMVSIPRDTRVIINGKARKINEILPRYGEMVLRSLIEDLMQIQISRYVKVDFQGFINIIDIMGGIEIDIEKNMDYDDNWGKLHIHFAKGLNKLDGKQSLNYVRFRADANADLGRIKRQQKFIKILLEKAMTPGVFVKLPQIVSEAFKHVETDFTIQEIFAILQGFSDSKVEFKTASLPGEARYIDKISYFLPYKDKSIEMGTTQFSDLAAIELVASYTPRVMATETINEN